MNFDLSRMKKVSQDEKSATFHHPDGHTIKVATHSLSEKMRKQLNEIPTHEVKKAEGGEIKQQKPKPPKEDPGPNIDKEKAAKVSQGFNNAVGFAEGGEAPEEFVPGKDYKEASKTGRVEGAPPPVVVNVQAPQAPEPNSSGVKGPEFHAAGATPAPESAEATPAEVPKQAQPPEQAQPLAAAQPDMPAQQPQPVQPQAPAQPQVQAQPVASEPEKVYQGFKAAQTQENQGIASDLQNGHITPETYSSLSDKAHLGKIGTIFGLLLSSAGSGLSHQPNALLAMMDKEIDRDLEAQKTNQQNKFNLYSLSKKQLLENAQIAHMNFETEEGKKKLDILTKNDAKQKKLAIDFHGLKKIVDNIPDSDPKKPAALAQLGRVYNAVQEKITSLEDINAGIAASSVLAKPTTKAQEHVDTDYAKSYNEWTSTGKANIDSNIKNLEDAKKALQKNPSLSGGLTGALPDRLTSNDVLRQRQLVRSAIMGSLRQILGPQFTENEGERIFNTVYNEKADSKVNLESISDYLDKLKNVRSENDSKANYYEKNGSLTGFKAGNNNENEAAIAWANAHPEDPRSRTILGLVKGR